MPFPKFAKKTNLTLHWHVCLTALEPSSPCPPLGSPEGLSKSLPSFNRKGSISSSWNYPNIYTYTFIYIYINIRIIHTYYICIHMYSSSCMYIYIYIDIYIYMYTYHLADTTQLLCISFCNRNSQPCPQSLALPECRSRGMPQLWPAGGNGCRGGSRSTRKSRCEPRHVAAMRQMLGVGASCLWKKKCES